MTVYVCDGELVCEDCAVDVTEDEAAIGGESDSTEYCSYCHCPLFDTFGLTRDGYAALLSRVESELKEGTRTRPDWRWERGYYEGLNHHASLRDAVEHFESDYFRDNRARRILQWYLYLTADLPGSS